MTDPKFKGHLYNSASPQNHCYYVMTFCVKTIDATTGTSAICKTLVEPKQEQAPPITGLSQREVQERLARGGKQ